MVLGQVLIITWMEMVEADGYHDGGVGFYGKNQYVKWILMDVKYF